MKHIKLTVRLHVGTDIRFFLKIIDTLKYILYVYREIESTTQCKRKQQRDPQC